MNIVILAQVLLTKGHGHRHLACLFTHVPLTKHFPLGKTSNYNICYV